VRYETVRVAAQGHGHRDQHGNTGSSNNGVLTLASFSCAHHAKMLSSRRPLVGHQSHDCRAFCTHTRSVAIFAPSGPPRTETWSRFWSLYEHDKSSYVRCDVLDVCFWFASYNRSGDLRPPVPGETFYVARHSIWWKSGGAHELHCYVTIVGSSREATTAKLQLALPQSLVK
jgi:hypothetical protein